MKMQDLDTMLKRRRFEPSRSGLSERIIAAARPVRQVPPPSFFEVMSRQAIMLVAMLVMGLTIGFTMPDRGGDDDGLYRGFFDDNGAMQ